LLILKKDILTKIDTTIPTVVLHGCNCLHTMGAGIAKYLSTVYPQVYSADVSQTKKHDKSKLGTFSTAIITPKFHILNCYTQYDYMRRHSSTPPVDYDAIRNCCKKVAERYKGWEIRTPKIGCGLAGGQWSVVQAIFTEELKGLAVTVYEK